MSIGSGTVSTRWKSTGSVSAAPAPASAANAIDPGGKLFVEGSVVEDIVDEVGDEGSPAEVGSSSPHAAAPSTSADAQSNEVGNRRMSVSSQLSDLAS